jgi:hypothetical protein
MRGSIVALLSFSLNEKSDGTFVERFKFQCRLRDLCGRLIIAARERLASNDVECVKTVLPQPALFKEHQVLTPARKQFCFP